MLLNLNFVDVHTRGRGEEIVEYDGFLLYEIRHVKNKMFSNFDFPILPTQTQIQQH